MKRILIAGLLVWAPLGITLWVLHLLVTTLDQTLGLLPDTWQPDRLLGFHIPGLGVLLAFLILLVTGAIAANFFGARLILLWEAVLGRIPFVKSIYSSVKQVSDTLLSGKGNAFRKALLVEFPYEGSWTIGFLTGTPDRTVAPHLPGDHVSVYVPTTPNPTGGYFVMLPRSRVRELEMSVDEALKYIISMGVVAPRGSVLPLPPFEPAHPADAGAAIASRN
ncbi:MAG: DUF502 domain-containing protein [Betaproteobacteria bacterium]